MSKKTPEILEMSALIVGDREPDYVTEAPQIPVVAPEPYTNHNTDGGGTREAKGRKPEGKWLLPGRLPPIRSPNP